jgi:hypothetical protein
VLALEPKNKPFEKVNLLDERFARLLQEVRDCLNEDEEQEVFFFDHQVAGENHPIQTRTAVIHWEPEQFLIIQSHFWFKKESEPETIRLPASAVKFMCAELLERSIYAAGYKVSPNGVKELKHSGWAEKEGGINSDG